MDRLFGPEGAAGQLNGTVGNDLVDIHVGLGAATRLPNAQREMIVELTLSDLGGGLSDPTGFVLGQQAELSIGEGACFFQQAKGMDERGRHPVLGDIEVV